MPQTTNMVGSNIQSTRTGFYGYDSYIAGRQLEIEDIEEKKVSKLIAHIVAEAESFKIKLTDNFIREVE